MLFIISAVIILLLLGFLPVVKWSESTSHIGLAVVLMVEYMLFSISAVCTVVAHYSPSTGDY